MTERYKLEIGVWNLGFVWDLEIVIWNLRWPLNCNRLNGYEIKGGERCPKQI
jgi:hypothetical protein